MKLFQLFVWGFPLLLFPVLMGVPVLDGTSGAPSTEGTTVIEGKVSVATDESVMVNFNGQTQAYTINADTVIRKDELMAQPMDLGKDDLVRVTAVRTPRDWVATNIEARSFK